MVVESTQLDLKKAVEIPLIAQAQAQLLMKERYL